MQSLSKHIPLPIPLSIQRNAMLVSQEINKQRERTCRCRSNEQIITKPTKQQS